MKPDEIQNLIQQEVSKQVTNHRHTGTDALQIYGNNLHSAPQPSLTIASGGTLSSGGITNLSNADHTILANAVARLNQLEIKLQKLGLIL